MKRITLLTALGVAFLLSLGCDWRGIRGNGNLKTESRSVTAFTRIDAGGFYQINWQPGSPTLTVTTDENLLSHVTTEMEGDVLKIHLRGHIAPTKRITIAVSSPSLTGADLNGAVSMNVASLAANTFALETSGATKVTVAGKVNRLLASLTGASKLDAANLAAETVEVSVTGAGKADVCASDRLRAAITGAGKVSYSCHPKSVEKKISGAGKIEPRD